MAERLEVHPTHPQPRAVRRAEQVLREGGLIAYPTDSGYAFGWRMDSNAARERVTKIRRLDARHPFTVICRHLSEVGACARLSDQAFRLLKKLTPGPYTFVLPASPNLPRAIRQNKRRSIGVRVPDHAVPQALVEALGEPLLSSSLILPGEDMSEWTSEDLAEHVSRVVDLFLDGGDCGPDPTTVLDLEGDTVTVLREGAGPLPE
ncbi:MAG TPA: L-threonylcarbamoyladenylate synthase [Xanthomonadaceae bacterium]|nr:L-threonylcarbamoyladenylate synthase [Xanthomonadaceae bacterium]